MTTTQRIKLYQTLTNEVFDLNQEQITDPYKGYPIHQLMQELKRLLQIDEVLDGVNLTEGEPTLKIVRGN